jgi:hypothetical protein
MGDLIDWAVSLVEGNQKWHEAEPLPWPEEVARFFRGLKTLDERIAAADLSEDVANRLFQGPIADALTHTGQLAMLRRMAGCPIAGENYFIADIAIGCVGDGAVAAAQELLIMPAPGPESPLNRYPEGCTRSKWKCGSGKIKTRGCIA